MPAFELRFVYALIVDTSLDEVLNEFAGRPSDSLPPVRNPEPTDQTFNVAAHSLGIFSGSPSSAPCNKGEARELEISDHPC